MTYRVEVAPAALRQLRKLDPPARRRVQAAIELLADLSTTEGLTERTEYFAQPRQSAERESQSAVVFRVGAEWLGISTGVVYQVTRPARIH